MGERVVIDPHPGADPPRAAPLDYAGPGASNPWLERAAAHVRLVGGIRQILFAVGLACAGAGIGELGRLGGSGTAAGWLFFGGLLLGFAIPAPRWRA